MVEDGDKKDEEKLELNSAGQTIAYISLDQACVLALQYARDNRVYAIHALTTVLHCRSQSPPVLRRGVTNVTRVGHGTGWACGFEPGQSGI